MEWKTLDPRMLGKTIENPEQIDWYDPRNKPFTVSGLYWFQEEKSYARLPKKSWSMLRVRAPGVAVLQHNPAGGQISFMTDSKRIVVRAKLSGVHDFDHLTAIGQCGMDCYESDPSGIFRFEGVTRIDRSRDSYVCEIARSAGMQRALINLPNYMGVEALEIGVNKGSKVLPYAPYANRAPIVFYGTSITQGGCASRPGLMYTNILSRRMRREFFNFGFSGSGNGETEVVELIAEIENPALFAIAYEANTENELYTTLEPLLDTYRARHPLTPILLISRLHVQSDMQHADERVSRGCKREYQRKCVEGRRAAGDHQIYFVDGSSLLGDFADECFVDGVHPNDLGFWRIADALEPTLRALVE